MPPRRLRPGASLHLRFAPAGAGVVPAGDAALREEFVLERRLSEGANGSAAGRRLAQHDPALARALHGAAGRLAQLLTTVDQADAAPAAARRVEATQALQTLDGLLTGARGTI